MPVFDLFLETLLFWFKCNVLNMNGVLWVEDSYFAKSELVLYYFIIWVEGL